MTMNFYKPEKTVTGPAYSMGFKIFATVFSVGLFVYAINITLRFPLPVSYTHLTLPTILLV